MINNEKQVSKASLSRISFYLSYLNSLDSSIDRISATTISKALNLGEVLVRKDLANLCGTGKPKVGYDINYLIAKLSSYNANVNGNCIVVGAGKLGCALLNHSDFEKYGINLIAGFDLHPGKVEQTNKPIYELDLLKTFCAENDVNIGIITVPSEAAQEVLNLMYSCGIRKFMCFSSTKLQVPEDAIIHYENMALSLSYLKNIKNK